MLKFYKRIAAPKLAAQGFARHYVAGMLQQRQQDLERLFGNPDFHTRLVDLAGSRIDLNRTETITRRRCELRKHLRSLSSLVRSSQIPFHLINLDREENVR
jgi:hypothetical protein